MMRMVNLMNASIPELCQVPGIGPSRAVQPFEHAAEPVPSIERDRRRRVNRQGINASNYRPVTGPNIDPGGNACCLVGAYLRELGENGPPILLKVLRKIFYV
jgi:hypothetical protein